MLNFHERSILFSQESEHIKVKRKNFDIIRFESFDSKILNMMSNKASSEERYLDFKYSASLLYFFEKIST